MVLLSALADGGPLDLEGAIARGREFQAKNGKVGWLINALSPEPVRSDQLFVGPVAEVDRPKLPESR